MRNIFLLLFCIAAFGEKISGQESFEVFLKNHVAELFYDKTNLGLSVIDLSNGKSLAGFQENKWFVPASSLKIITTLAAFDILGKDFQYKTHLLMTGSKDHEGILYGDIILQGNGDPTFGSERWEQKPNLNNILETIVNQIQKTGIKEIKGKILVDASVFDDDPLSPSWQWNDIANYYGGGAHGFNVSENEYNLFFHRETTIGQKTKLERIEPYIPHLMVENEVTVGASGSGDQSYIFTQKNTYQKVVRGSIPYGKTIFKTKGTIPDPGMFMAYRMYESLTKAGIICEKDQFGMAVPTIGAADTLFTFVSPDLGQILKKANAESINLYCEAIIKTLGRQITGKGQRSAGLEVVCNFLDSMGLNQQDLHLEDGCGLSARNYIPPAFFTRFLQKMVVVHGQDEILNLLPKAGADGTVKGLLAENPGLQASIWAKSGSMSGIYSLTGICLTSSGKRVAYSIILNGSPAKESKQNRKQLEKILSAIHKYY